MNRNKRLTRTMAAAMAGLMVANAGMGSVYAAETSSDVNKEETVYVKASASGATEEIIVSDWLKNTTGTTIADKTDLTDIKNVKGDESFTQDGDAVTWDANGNDIYYQGNTTKDLPVSMKVTYYLDGTEISAEDLAGKSGHVKIVYQYTNNLKEGDVYTPFLMVSGMLLSTDNFSNVTVTNGKVISDGDKNIVVGIGLPGMQDSLEIDKSDSEIWDDLDIDLDIPDSFEVEADVTDFELSLSMTLAEPLSLSDLGLDDIDDIDDLKDKIEELTDASEQLVDGTGELADGVQELKDGCVDLLDGTTSLDDGMGQLNSGISQLNSKKGSLVSGVKKLDSGASQLDDGAGTLQSGMNAFVQGLNQLDGDSLAEGLKAMASALGELEPGTEEMEKGIKEIYKNLGSKEMTGEDVTLIYGSNAVTEGLAKIKAILESTADDALKTGLETMKTTMTEVHTKVHAYAGTDGESTTSKIADLAATMNTYVNAVNGYLDASASNSSDTSTTETQSEESQETTPVASSVEVSFADTNADAVASLQAAIAGDQAVLNSLYDVRSQKSSVPDEVMKEFSSAYSTYSAQLDNCIAQLESDIAQQQATLAALQQTQTVTTTQEVQSEPTKSVNDDGNGDAAAPQDATMDKEALKQMGSTLNSSVAELAQAITMVDTALEGWIDGIDQIYNAVYGTSTEENLTLSDAITAAYAGSKGVTDGLETLKASFEDSEEGLLFGSATVAYVIKAMNAQLQQIDIAALKDGIKGLKDGATQLQSGTDSLKEGTAALSSGTSALKTGADALASGVGQLASGSAQLKSGTSQLKDGTVTLDDGVGELLDGTNELKDGMEEFDEEAIQKIADFTDDDLQEIVDRLNALTDAGDAYQLFTDGADGSTGSVKFIIETAAIEADED